MSEDLLQNLIICKKHHPDCTYLKHNAAASFLECDPYTTLPCFLSLFFDSAIDSYDCMVSVT